MDDDGREPEWYPAGTQIDQVAEATWQCPECLQHGLFVRLYSQGEGKPPREFVECPNCDYRVEAG